jgi:hypothetical protein
VRYEGLEGCGEASLLRMGERKNNREEETETQGGRKRKEAFNIQNLSAADNLLELICNKAWH